MKIARTEHIVTRIARVHHAVRISRDVEYVLLMPLLLKLFLLLLLLLLQLLLLELKIKLLLLKLKLLLMKLLSSLTLEQTLLLIHHGFNTWVTWGQRHWGIYQIRMLESNGFLSEKSSEFRWGQTGWSFSVCFCFAINESILLLLYCPHSMKSCERGNISRVLGSPIELTSIFALCPRSDYWLTSLV